MANEKQTLEIAGADVETAIEQGLARLGLAREQVEVEVLDAGSKGLLGLGRREALVRLTAKDAGMAPTAPRPAAAAATPRPAPPPAARPAPAAPKAPPAPVAPPPPATPSEIDALLQEEMSVAAGIWQELLARLQVEAQLSTYLSPQDEITGRQLPILDVRGGDLSPLIGPRGETLGALQFISRLMVSHALKRRSNFVVDVAGYRERRRVALNRLAQRMASKVEKRGRPVTLEPMPANERRVIHIALRDSQSVYTESTGEGRDRRVRIYPK